MCDLGALEQHAMRLWEDLQKNPVVKKALHIMECGMPPERYPYHNVGHAHAVAKEAVLLGLYDGLNSRELELLAIAAAYHDAGFLFTYDTNEVFGAALAEMAMRHSALYTANEVEQVKQAIMGTVVKLHPAGGLMQSVAEGDILGRYLADADLGNFGMDTFFDESEKVFKESLIHGKVPEDTAETRGRRHAFSVLMLRNHTYYTRAGRDLRETKKHENLARLEA